MPRHVQYLKIIITKSVKKLVINMTYCFQNLYQNTCILCKVLIKSQGDLANGYLVVLSYLETGKGNCGFGHIY